MSNYNKKFNPYDLHHIAKIRRKYEKTEYNFKNKNPYDLSNIAKIRRKHGENI